MKTVKFKYDLDQEVKTPFGEKGIVTMLGVDEGGLMYAVSTASDSKWFKESRLTEFMPEDKKLLRTDEN